MITRDVSPVLAPVTGVPPSKSIAWNIRPIYRWLALGFGIVLSLAMEGRLNMGVTTALLPNKGLPLPFLSYGGSSLLSAMIGVGILISIHRQSSYESKKDLLQLRRRRMTAAA